MLTLKTAKAFGASSSTSLGCENRHQQHCDRPVSATGALIVDLFETKITVGAIAYE
jgi:hypothetical protein